MGLIWVYMDFIWVYMGLIWVYMDFIWVYMGLIWVWYGFIWVYMGLYGISGKYIKLSILRKAHRSSIHSAKTGQNIEMSSCIWQQNFVRQHITTSNSYFFPGVFSTDCNINMKTPSSSPNGIPSQVPPRLLQKSHPRICSVLWSQKAAMPYEKKKKKHALWVSNIFSRMG